MANKVKLRKLIKKAVKDKDFAKVQTLIVQFSESFGENETDDLIQDVLENLTFEEREWWTDQLPEKYQKQMQDEAYKIMFQTLEEAGFKFGKDFSMATNGGLTLSKEAQDFLLSQVPEEHRESIKEEMFEFSQNPYELIEEQLGVPFFDNLVKRVKARLKTIDDESASLYILNIIAGIENCHPELDNFGTWFIANVISKERFKKLINIESENKPDVAFFLSDIICAAGGENEIKEENETDWLSLNGLKLLSKVWDGDNLSIKDLIAQASK